jgi:DNA-binding LytR/AlgR family response regulator
MEKIKVLVVEDEIIIADNICDTLRGLGYRVLEPAINFTEAIEIIENDKPDIAILDVQLSGKKTGIDLAKVIVENYKFPFIFLTSNSDKITLAEAKKATPAAYLVKPFSKRELYTSIEVALYNFSKKFKPVVNEELIIKDALFLKVKGVYQKIMFDDILYLKSEHVYLELFLTNNKTLLVRANFNNILNALNQNFIRIHRSYIINSKYLTQIENGSLKIENKTIPVGKKYRQEILNKINYI